MADWGQFEDGMSAAQRPVACQVCEAMLPDAVDGMLSETEQRAFDRHVAGCVVCSQELEEAQRGAAWLGLLKQQSPEPAPMLLERILAQTTGAAGASAGVQPVVPAIAGNQVVAEPPVWAGLPEKPVRTGGWAASLWQSARETLSLEWMKPMLQPRMAMTAAMAFFSVALTLNLTGVRLRDLSAASFRPSSIRRAVADRGAAAVRSFQNSRMVYQAEAQVNDLRTSWDQGQQEQPKQEEPAPQPKQEQDKPKQETPQGSSRLDFEPVYPRGAGMTKKGA